jgi:prolyl 3-hydroxylase /prolyl 3,4-dihydroxylase
MTLVTQWLAPKYHDPNKFRKLYGAAKPYPHASLHGFFREEKAKAIAAALAKEPFFEKESDLFKLSQTNELAHTQQPVLRELRAFLASKEFSAYMYVLTGVKLTNKALDMGGSKYMDTDFLLCHDDRVTGRKIAYIFYFNQTFTAKDGGALALFSNKGKHPGAVVKRYAPTWNTFNFFTVSAISWHSVEEITGKKARLSVNGWFH